MLGGLFLNAVSGVSYEFSLDTQIHTIQNLFVDDILNFYGNIAEFRKELLLVYTVFVRA